VNPERTLRLVERSQAQVRQCAQWLRSQEVSPPGGDFLHFLGTGGNPSGVISQRRRTGGLWLSLGGQQITIDPGPGAAYHAARAGLDTRALDAIVISHGHTDHYLDAGALIEGMCRGMSQHRGLLGLPRAMLDGGMLCGYHLGREPNAWYGGGPEIRAWREGETLRVGTVSVTPFAAHHGPENYGLSFVCDGRRIVYSSDTSYVLSYRDLAGTEHVVRAGETLLAPAAISSVREDLVEAFRDADLAVLNVSFFFQHAHRHLTAVGAADLLRRAHVRRAWLTHFDNSIGPWAAEVARFVGEASGVPVMAARDGKRVPLGST